MAETNVGTLAARLKLHTSEFDAGIGSAEKSLKSFSGSIKNIAIGTAVGSAIVTGIKTVTNEIVNLGKSSFNAVADAQQLEASLKSLVTTELVKASDGTLSYADASKQASKQTAKLTDYIRDLSIQSPFTNATVTRAFQFNASMGQSIETAKKTTEALLNLGAGLSLSEAEFSGLSIAIGQVGSTGKITQQDLRQFANNRFGLDKLNDVFDRMSDSTGVVIKNTDDFNEAMASGKVSADDFYGALSRYASENYSGSVKEMAGTFRGMSSTFKDIGYWAKVDLFKPLGDSFARAFSPVLEWLATALGDGGFKNIGEKIAMWFKPAVDIVGQFGKDLNELGWTDALQNLKTNLLNLLPDDLADELVKVGNGFTTAFEWISTNKDTLITALEGIAIALVGLKLAKFAASLTNLVNPLFLILLAAGGIAILIAEINKNWETEKLSLTEEDLKGVADSAQKVADSKANFKEMWDLLFPPTQKDSALKTASDDFDTVTHATDVWLKKTEDWNNTMSTVLDGATKVLETIQKVKNIWNDLFGKDDAPSGSDARASWSAKKGDPINLGSIDVNAKEVDTTPLINQVNTVMKSGISNAASEIDSKTLFAPLSNIKVPLPDLTNWSTTFSSTGQLVKDAGTMVTAIGTELQKINNAENQQPLTEMQQFWIDNFGTLSDTLVGHSIVPDMMLAIHTSIKSWLTTSNDTVKLLLLQMETAFQTTATNIQTILASITGGGVEAPAVETGGTQPAGGGFSTLILSITELKTQLDALNLTLVYTLALLGNVTGLQFLLTTIDLFVSGQFTTTLTNFATFIGLGGTFGAALEAMNRMLSTEGSTTSTLQVLTAIKTYIEVDLTTVMTAWATFVSLGGTFGTALEDVNRRFSTAGSTTSLLEVLTAIKLYIEATFQPTMQTLAVFWNTTFRSAGEALVKLLYTGRNSIYNSLGAIQGVLEDIWVVMGMVVKRILGELNPAFQSIVEPAGAFQGAVEAAAATCSGLADEANAAAAAVWALIAAMDALNSGNYYRPAPGQGTGDRWKASGGSVKAGETYVVGEQGAELFTPRRSGWIIPNDEAFGEDSAKGGNVYHFEFHDIYGDANLETKIKRAVVNGMKEAEFYGFA